MFTGIVTDVGIVAELSDLPVGKRIRINSKYDSDTIDIGASIAHAGVCLTVVEKGKGWFDVEAWEEALRLTTLGKLKSGDRINPERSLCIGDELGGHLVSGHVDGLAEIVDMTEEGGAVRYTLQAPQDLAKFIAPKGSVALNGTSLTVNEVNGDTFGVNIIPHTKQVTTWGLAQPGDRINLEIDTLARYVARLSEYA